MIRVLVADDQRVVREGLVMLVGLVDGIEVVGAAADGSEAIRLSLELRPDVVLMDLRMPGVDGVAATRRLQEELPELRVLVLTTYADDASLFPALQAGARGYLTKDASAEQIEEAIRALHAGQTWLDPVVQARLVAAVQAPQGAATPTETGAGAGIGSLGDGNPGGGGALDASGVSVPLPDRLTPREAEVVGLIASGLSNAEIGEHLYLSRATVKTHVNRILAKTGARDRAQVVRYAYDHGLVPPPAESP